QTIDHMVELARTLLQIDVQQAKAKFEQALSLAEKVHGADDPKLLDSLTALGCIDYDGREFDKAQATFERAVAISGRARGPEHEDTIALYCHLADTFQMIGDEALREQLRTHSLATQLGHATGFANVAGRPDRQIRDLFQPTDAARLAYFRALELRE